MNWIGLLNFLKNRIYPFPRNGHVREKTNQDNEGGGIIGKTTLSKLGKFGKRSRFWSAPWGNILMFLPWLVSFL